MKLTMRCKMWDIRVCSGFLIGINKQTPRTFLSGLTMMHEKLRRQYKKCLPREQRTKLPCLRRTIQVPFLAIHYSHNYRAQLYLLVFSFPKDCAKSHDLNDSLFKASAVSRENQEYKRRPLSWTAIHS